MIQKNKLLKLLEPHFEKDLTQDSYEVKTIKATKLLTYARFDIAFKLLYLEMKYKDVAFAKEFYKEHIKAFSLGKFTEPGNEKKDGIEKFLQDFDKTFLDIKMNGFDSNKTLLPLSKSGVLLNGAHRVASAIYLDKDVNYVEIESKEFIYDYKFFYNRTITTDTLDAVATKFIEYADTIYMACIWPTARGQDKEIEQIIPNIIYKKEIELNPNGAHNLLSFIYQGERWIGTKENNYKGVQGKLVECFHNFEPVRIIAFQARDLEEVMEIKERVRNLFHVAKHSIHITDTKEEAIELARVVFNDNGIHFLNYAKPNRYSDTHKKVEQFKEFIHKNQISFEDAILDSSIVLSAYGIREARDIDFLSKDVVTLCYEGIEVHDTELIHHALTKQELLYNSRNYFYFEGLKFVALPQLYKMKKNRAETKDLNDMKMVEALLENNQIKKFLSKMKQKFLYGKIAFRQKLVNILKKIGLFEIVKKIKQTVVKR